MTNSQLLELLREKRACEDALGWVGTRDLATAWQECPRGDWLLWLCAKQVGQAGWPTHREVVLAACACAETALVHVPAGENRPRLAIETARAWARGEATLPEVRKAASAAYASAAYAAVAYASAAAAYAAACAAAYASAAAAADARSRSLAQSADLVRSLLTIPGRAR